MRDAATHILGQREIWYEKIRSDPAFQDRGGTIYPYDTMGANLANMFELFNRSGFAETFESDAVRSVCDVGCANGELAFAMSGADLMVSAIDYSFKHDQAPYVVSKISEECNFRVNVSDMSVDRYFTLDDVKRSRVSNVYPMPDLAFDLMISFGLLYHLRNPFAFIESLRSMTRYAVIGTHIMTHLPNLTIRVDGSPLGYLLHPEELNGDPSNYWVLTLPAFKRLVERSGFKILGELLLPNNPLELAVPNRVDLGIRTFLMLEAK